MRIKVILIAAVLAGLLFSLSASAQTCTCDNPLKTEKACETLPIQKTSFNKIIEIPKFDSSLGCLKSVRITSVSRGFVWTEVDNEDTEPVTWQVVAVGAVRTTLPLGLGEIFAEFGTGEDGTPIFTPADDPNELPPDSDFNPDYAGPDYVRIDYGTLANPKESAEEELILESDTEMEPFIGSAGEKLGISVSSASKSDAEGASNNRGVQGLSWMGATVCVEYTYCPRACIIGSKVGCEDEPLEGWTITLTKPDGSTDTRVTDADGQYKFCNLFPGSYDVCEETRPGWYAVGPNCYNDIILGGEDVYVNAFKNTEHFCITGYKYNVTNNAEEPLEGWTITLTKPDGSTVIDTTDANGYYEFCDLANGLYKVSEALKTGWIAKSPASVNVEVYCEDESVDFRNAKQPNLVCVCPFFIRNELYGASCKEVKVVDASKGVISNDPPGSVVLNPESITIDPKYGTIEVNEDGSFVYDPTVATGRLYSGMYVMFKYNANNGLCDSVYPGIAKIQLRC